MTKLVLPNIYPVTRTVSSPLSSGGETQPLSFNDSFLADFQEFSPNLYVFRAKDGDHELRCEMTLEVKEIFVCPEEEDHIRLAPVVACSIPRIDVDKFNEKVVGDDYLHGMLMFQFQLKILEQLFLFCEEKEAVNLILTIHDVSLEYVEIYRRFIVSEEKVSTTRGEKTQVVIPAGIDTYDKVVDFMGDIERDLKKTLWRGQTANPAFRQYLKEHSLLP